MKRLLWHAAVALIYIPTVFLAGLLFVGEGTDSRFWLVTACATVAAVIAGSWVHSESLRYKSRVAQALFSLGLAGGYIVSCYAAITFYFQVWGK